MTNAWHAASGTAGAILAGLQSGEVPVVNDKVQAANIGRAMAGLMEKPILPLAEMLEVLKKCREALKNSNRESWISTVRRGIARLDEIYFSDQY